MIKKYSLDHFAISLILPLMVVYYYFREIKSIGPALDALQDERGKPHFEGEDRKQRIRRQLWIKRDFHMAVAGAVVGFIGYLVWLL